MRAVISRGGRPDLAGPSLARVRAPTLLIVGGHDSAVLDLNRRASAEMHAEVQLEVVPGAGHLFEEPGALEAVSRLAVDLVPALPRRVGDGRQRKSVTSSRSLPLRSFRVMCA